MVKLMTSCNGCLYKKNCKYKDNAKMLSDRLNNTQFGDGPNDDYNWDIMSEHYHVDIEIRCPDYRKEVPIPRGHFK